MSDRSCNLFYVQLEEECSGKYVQNEINKVLDEISAEIEALGTWRDKLLIETVDIRLVLCIIDKYRKGKECEK